MERHEPEDHKNNESLGGKENIARRVVAGHANCLPSDDLQSICRLKNCLMIHDGLPEASGETGSVRTRYVIWFARREFPRKLTKA